MSRDRIRIQVSCVLQFVDDFTEKVIEAQILNVADSKQRKPIRKQDGYYVFCGSPGEKLEITVSSPFYLTETLHVEGDREEVLRIRLKPGRNYPLPGGVTCMEGTAPPGSTIGVVFSGLESEWKLLYDYSQKKNGEQVEIYHPSRGDFTGMTFLIVDKEGKKEFFRVISCESEDGQCRMETALSRDYKKAGTRIYPFYHTNSDEKGAYFLPMRVQLPGTEKCSCYLNGKEIRETLEPGRNNIRHFS